jgi:hypothetical protein
MQLMRLSDVPEGEQEDVYALSRAWALVAVAIVLSASAVLIWIGWRRAAPPGYFIAGVMIVMLLLMRRLVLARFRPSNWLVRASDAGLLIQFRSYLNYHFPAADQTVAYIPYEEIRSAHAVRYENIVMGHRATFTESRRGWLVELELSGEAEALSAALSAEASRSGPREKRWYGSTSYRYCDVPARMSSPTTLQLQWQATPSARAFVAALSRHIEVGETVQTRRDYGSLRGMNRQQQEEQLLQLAQAGDKIAAIKIARNLYGYDLRAARDFVEDLTGRKAHV